MSTFAGIHGLNRKTNQQLRIALERLRATTDADNAIKPAVLAATTAALAANTATTTTLTANANGAIAAQDGVTLVLNDRLLVKNEVAQTSNGIYIVAQVGTASTPFILLRATDADVSTEIKAGLLVVVTTGTTLADTIWELSTNDPITLGTTNLTFIKVSGAIDGSGTTNEIAYWTDSDTLGALAVATYPSLTELSYVKGVTSAIQTQFTGKANTALSNLASVAINTTLVSDTDSTDDLGSTTVAWANLYVDTIKSITGNPLSLTPIAGQSLTVNLATTGDLVVNTNQLFVDTSLGYVGIGDATPAAKLEITGANQDYGLIVNTNDGSAHNNALVVRKEGYVGIGIDPTYAFDVNVATSLFRGSAILANTVTTGSVILAFAQTVDGSTPFYIERFGSAHANTGRVDFINTGNININNRLLLDNGTGDVTVNTGGIGNLGVAITPTARLHVKGSTSDASADALLVEKLDGTDILVVQNDGFVGIGQATPLFPLHVMGTTTPAQFESTNTFSYLNFKNTTNTSIIGNEDTKTFFAYDNAYRLVVNRSTGYTGIGSNVTAPTEQLTVVGNISIGNLAAGTSASNTIAFGRVAGGTPPASQPADIAQVYGNDISGVDGTMALHIMSETGTVHSFGTNVGINTITPSAKLHVLQGVLTTGSPTAFLLVGGAHTTLTASTESIGANLNFSATKQFATGALTTQREIVLQAPTYGFVAASVVTDAATLAITGAPIAGTNATITNSYALWVQAGTSKFSGRIQETQGADVASATNLTLGSDGNVFEITGTTKIDLISNVGWQNGSKVTLVANESVTIDHGTATSGTNITILLAGASDFAMTANDTLTLCLCETTAGGVAWREISRTAI